MTKVERAVTKEDDEPVIAIIYAVKGGANQETNREIFLSKKGEQIKEVIFIGKRRENWSIGANQETNRVPLKKEEHIKEMIFAGKRGADQSDLRLRREIHLKRRASQSVLHSRRREI